ncbi:MAG: hypothetical protein MUE41_01280 [Gemmatimonadaceae bacterium]|jgi:hypothetical protein|nr:hypothetical protein [Gemmatimonadaceae bacterium]
MWDNRHTKRSGKAPDFKCKDRSCAGRLWPDRETGIRATLGLVDAAGRVAVRPAATPGATHVSPVSTPAAPPSTAAAADAPTPAPDRHTADFQTRSALRACYRTATDFVLTHIVPRYVAAGIPVKDRAIAAMVATVFRATVDRGALDGLTTHRADATDPEDSATSGQTTAPTPDAQPHDATRGEVRP